MITSIGISDIGLVCQRIRTGEVIVASAIDATYTVPFHYNYRILIIYRSYTYYWSSEFELYIYNSSMNWYRYCNRYQNKSRYRSPSKCWYLIKSIHRETNYFYKQNQFRAEYLVVSALRISHRCSEGGKKSGEMEI